MVPSISRGQPPPWLQQEQQQLGAGQEGGAAAGGAATTIPGLAAVPMRAGDWRSLARKEEAALGHPHGGSPAALAAPRPILPPPPTPPMQQYVASPLPAGALWPLDARSPSSQLDYGLHGSYGGGGVRGAGEGDDDDDDADGASVLAALEMIGDGKGDGDVPVLVAEMAEMFALDEGPPAFERGQIYDF